MSTDTPTKINQLLSSQPPGVVFQSRWLTKQGYSLDLQRKYRSGKWLKSIGSGAMIRTGDNVGYEGAIYSLQKQTKMSVHPAGRTALALLGKAHYLDFATQRIILFGTKGEVLPAWFHKHDWGRKVEYRLFLYLAEKAGYKWFDHLKTDKVNLGSGKRSIVKHGVYVDKYQMTVPKEWEEREYSI